MTCTLLTGVSHSTIHRRVCAGKAIKVARGFHVTRKPTPSELLAIVQAKWPEVLPDGQTAAQIRLGQQLEFPLALAAPHRLPPSEFYHSRVTKQLESTQFKGQKILLPVLAVSALADASLATKFLETHYGSFRGHERLDRDLLKVTRLPARTRELIEYAGIGADSEPEKIVAKALRDRGYKVELNKGIGHYRWDIVIPKHKVAIEIDGYDFHKSETREAFVRDRWKGNEAIALLYRPLRYTGSCVTYHLSKLVDQIDNLCKRQKFQPDAVWRWHNTFLRQGESWEFENFA